MDKILGKDYKHLNRVFDIAQIKYGERPLLAYTHTMKPGIENVTKKKRAGGQLAKKTTKRKTVASPSSLEKLVGSDEDMGQETLSQLARDEEVKMISLVFNSSGLTPPMLIPLGDCFYNLEANVHSNVNLGEATLSSSQVNVGEDTLSSLVIHVQSHVATATAVATTIESQEEGEVATLASQETTGPSSQRFVAETPPGIAGDVGILHVASPPQVVTEDMGGGLVETGAPKVKALKGKGTTTVTLDFDESDDDVFDKEATNARASRLSKSTIDVNIGERVAYHLEKGVSTGKFFLLLFLTLII
jgi:hypothetical protein